MRRLSIILLALLGSVTRAGATDIVVTRFDDPPPNSCFADDCSLREALALANALPGLDRILLSAGTYALTLLGGDPFAGDLDITTGELEILGVGAAQTIIDGDAADDRVLNTSFGSSVVVAGLTVRNGDVTGAPGGGIANGGDLALIDCVVENNRSTLNGGGIAVFGGGSLLLIRTEVRNNTALQKGGGIFASNSIRASFSSITGNQAPSGGGFYLASPGSSGSQIEDTTLATNQATSTSGGGIFVEGGELSIVRSTISGNTAQQSGGAVHNAGGTVAFTDTTLSGNRAKTDGGGLFNAATAQLLSTTIAGNTADSDLSGGGNGGGVFVAAGGGAVLTAVNTLIGDNIDLSLTGSRHPDCSGSVSSGGHNLIEITTGCTLVGGTGDITGQDPALLPLADYGGPTATRALLAGGPAIDAGDPAGCIDDLGAPLATDQRGASRSFDGDANGTARCDIGAFELVPGFLFADGFESGDVFGWSTAVP